MVGKLGRRVSICAALVGTLAGCYTLRPASASSLQVGTKVAIDVNDAGRVALGGTIGPEIGRIDGMLVSKENGEYLLAVSGVRYLRGGEQAWTGERVGIRSEFVGTAYERQFSKGRTTALSVAVLGGLVAVVVTRDLFGLGTIGRPDPIIDTTTALRIRRP